MADKTIGEIPSANSINDNSLFVMEQDGAAKSVTGLIFKNYAKSSAEQYSTAAAESAEAAEAAANSAAEAAENAQNVSLYSPKIIDGNWWTYDSQSQTYIDTDVSATGPQGPQGPSGSGTGDMLASVYDTQGKAQDVYTYADNAAQSAENNAIDASKTYTDQQIGDVNTIISQINALIGGNT